MKCVLCTCDGMVELPGQSDTSLLYWCVRCGSVYWPNANSIGKWWHPLEAEGLVQQRRRVEEPANEVRL